MNAKRTSRRVVLAGMASVALPRLATAQALPHVVAAGVTADDLVALWFGIKAGLFTRAGLNVEYVKSVSGTAATLGVIGGTYQLAITNVFGAILAHVKNVPLTILSLSGIYNNTPEYVAAVVRKDSPLQSATDLNGRTVGTAAVHDLNFLALAAWMDTHGGDSKTVKEVEVPFSVIPAALQEGRIDAGTLLQPFLSQALANGSVRVFANSYAAIAERFAYSVWVSTPTWAEANPDAARRFVRAMREAQNYCNAHRDETAVMLAQYSGADAEVIRKGGRTTFTRDVLAVRDLQPPIDIAAKYGALERRFDAAELISPVVRGA